MKITRKLGSLGTVRTVKTAGVLAAAALFLAACGTDSNTATTPSTTSTTTATSASSSAAPSSTSSASSTGTATSSGTSAASFDCATGDLRSSGSTAQGKVIEQWILDFNTKCGANVNQYGAGGSGKGISDFTSNQVDFAGSDSALNTDQATAAKTTRCAGADAINLPMVTGPIAIAYKIPGVTNLVVNADVLAKIFNSTITNWNDPAIAALNTGVTLPNLAIASVHRQEDSGTTENFTKYLKAVAPDSWPYPAAKAWAGTGGTSAQGSQGVADEVNSKDGTIGYLEWGYATDNKLSIAKVDTGSGTPVELTGESAGKAVAAATVVGTGKDVALKLDYATKEAGAYPIILVTYEIVCSSGNGAKLPVLKAFLGYAATDGQASLADLGAAPLPAEIQSKVVTSIQALA